LTALFVKVFFRKGVLMGCFWALTLISLLRTDSDNDDDEEDRWEDPNMFNKQKKEKKKRDRRGQPLSGSSNGAMEVLY